MPFSTSKHALQQVNDTTVRAETQSLVQQYARENSHLDHTWKNGKSFLPKLSQQLQRSMRGLSSFKLSMAERKSTYRALGKGLQLRIQHLVIPSGVLCPVQYGPLSINLPNFFDACKQQ
jgi:hypothetical protein